MFFWCLFLELKQTTRHLNIGVCLRWQTKLGRLTLIMPYSILCGIKNRGFTTYNSSPITSHWLKIICFTYLLLLFKINQQIPSRWRGAWRLVLWFAIMESVQGDFSHNSSLKWALIGYYILFVSLDWIHQVHSVHLHPFGILHQFKSGCKKTGW